MNPTRIWSFQGYRIEEQQNGYVLVFPKKLTETLDGKYVWVIDREFPREFQTIKQAMAYIKRDLDERRR